MKRVYVIVHLSVMVLFSIFTQLAFVMFLPAYVVAMFAGFELFSRKPRPHSIRARVRLLFQASIMQTLIFLALAFSEWALFVWLVKIPWPSSYVVVTACTLALVVSLAIFALIGALEVKNPQNVAGRE